MALLLPVLAGCVAEEAGAPLAAIAAARHVSNEAPYIALVSMVQKDNNRAAHTAMVINASERVIHDPAGTFSHPSMPERGDIHYGATDRMVDFYERYHARSLYFVHVQKLPVSAAVAEAALRRTQAQGPTAPAYCTIHTTEILNDVSGLPTFRTTFWPQSLREQMARVPGVQDRYVYEDDVGKQIPVN